ncbi:MAG: phosphodiester glycosidase family protein, partial [Verrucomicrobiota bacterium]
NLGCDEAMNLDGGGSAVCWVYGQVMNSPSEGRERGMANGLVVVQRKE